MVIQLGDLVGWDRGGNDDGLQIWGFEKAGYRFDRNGPKHAEATGPLGFPLVFHNASKPDQRGGISKASRLVDLIVSSVFV